MLAAIRSRYFGNATASQVLFRMVVDFGVANAVLVSAAVLRLVASGQLNLDNPVGQLIGKINSVYLVHAGWFAVSAGLLMVLTGLYCPRPSSQIRLRARNLTLACAIGLAMHLGLGGVLQDRFEATLEVAVPAWTLLGLSIFAIRFSRMSLSQHYRVEARKPARRDAKVEEVLVVGGAGYIGSVLTRQLLDKGYRVRILDCELFGRDSLDSMIDDPLLEYMPGDFRNVEDVVKALHGVDAVIHLAAIVGDPACALDSETTIAVNYAAAKMIAQLARANGISRFVFASTCSVYGASDDIMTEESPLNPVSLYATTKIDAERVLLEAADDVFQPTILRFATAYGWSYRPRFDLVANLFSAQAVTDKHIRVFNGVQWRPFVHTRDIARACVMAIEAPLDKVGGEIFNVGDHTQNYTLQQLGQIVAQCMPGTFAEEISNSEDRRDYRVNFSKIQRVLGFHAAVPLEEGVREMVEAVRSGAVTDWKDPVYSNVKTLKEAGMNILKFERPGSRADEELKTTREFLRRAA